MDPRGRFEHNRNSIVADVVQEACDWMLDICQGIEIIAAVAALDKFCLTQFGKESRVLLHILTEGCGQGYLDAGVFGGWFGRGLVLGAR